MYIKTKMFLKTKRQKAKDIKWHEKHLNELVGDSIKQEQESSAAIQKEEEHLKQLRNERCYEDTLAGRIQGAENAVIEDIVKSLNDLSKVTGKEYAKNIRCIWGLIKGNENL